MRECKQAQQYNRNPRNQQQGPIASAFHHEALENVMNHACGGREKVVVACRNYLGENRTEENRADRRSHAVACGVGNNAPRGQFSGSDLAAKHHAANHRQGHNDGLEHNRSGDPAYYRQPGITFTPTTARLNAPGYAPVTFTVQAASGVAPGMYPVTFTFSPSTGQTKTTTVNRAAAGRKAFMDAPRELASGVA